jgi:leucyl-tRNA synthetase
MKGFEVIHPMGWDAFGLPAENYAIKTGVHPELSTNENINNFRRQIKSLGFSYDWKREINTSNPEYYKWSQWFFSFLYKQGLAYRKEAWVNWCEKCATVLANEQVVSGKCERCESEVRRKKLKQWFFRITKYADKLLEGLEDLDWPEKLKTMQRNWIGKQEGLYIDFPLKDGSGKIRVFTKFAETIYGVTFLVLAPEHELISKIIENEKRSVVANYVKESLSKKEVERNQTLKEKTGVFTGAFAKHPLTNEELPIWVGDFVLADFGTGAVMGVPSHDKRDFIFAKQHDLKVIRVIGRSKEDKSGVKNLDEVIEEGVMVNSKELNGLENRAARERIKKIIQEKGLGEKASFYHIRDWLISRQRYWGAPIPVVYCDACGEVILEEKDLPVLLPKSVTFKKGKSSLLGESADFVKTKCPKCQGEARRETDTMDGFVDNSWYFLRYLDAQNKEKFCSKEKIKRWMPVDLYVGGAEHAVGHLIYSRFFIKVLNDAGFLDFKEPFLKLVNQGIILAEDGKKMSKSKGNVVNPDEVVARYGADTIRLYEMFMGPLKDAKPWNTRSILGVRRLLEKIWNKFGRDIGVGFSKDEEKEVSVLVNKLIKKIESDIEGLRLNTAISSIMEFFNEVGIKVLSKDSWEKFLIIFSCFAPHFCEELWEKLGNKTSVTLSNWPKFDEDLVKDKKVFLVVQVNGKFRDRLEISPGMSAEEVWNIISKRERVRKWVEGKEVRKKVYVPDKLLNLVV